MILISRTGHYRFSLCLPGFRGRRRGFRSSCWAAAFSGEGNFASGSRLGAAAGVGGRTGARKHLHQPLAGGKRDDIGDIAPGAAQRAARNIVFLADRADFGAARAADAPYDLDVLLARSGRSDRHLAVDVEIGLAAALNNREVLPAQKARDRLGERGAAIARSTGHRTHGHPEPSAVLFARRGRGRRWCWGCRLRRGELREARRLQGGVPGRRVSPGTIPAVRPAPPGWRPATRGRRILRAPDSLRSSGATASAVSAATRSIIVLSGDCQSSAVPSMATSRSPIWRLFASSSRHRTATPDLPLCSD